MKAVTENEKKPGDFGNVYKGLTEDQKKKVSWKWNMEIWSTGRVVLSGAPRRGGDSRKLIVRPSVYF